MHGKTLGLGPPGNTLSAFLPASVLVVPPGGLPASMELGTGDGTGVDVRMWHPRGAGAQCKPCWGLVPGGSLISLEQLVTSWLGLFF